MTEFELIRPAAPGPRALVFICDHASNRLPERYGTLGLQPELLRTHIAYDIGAAEVARTLAMQFGSPAVLATYSRLLIDLNRGVDDPTLVMKLSDGSLIEGNAKADALEIALRTRAFHTPYHEAIAAEIASFRARDEIPTIISLHSFTPAWKGRKRPWEVGVLWDRDGRLAKPLLARLAASGFCVGDNEPYSGELENDCLYRHGTINGLPHVLIEIRQDLIGDDASARAFARRLKPILAGALDDMGRAHIQFTRPL
jgi:predicted N-formylglutamate amidohydrolase